MKIVLGINAYHADASSCILIDGKLIAAVEEERINRKKHFSGYPDESIKECLKIANIKDIEITDVAFNTKPLGNLAPKINFFVKNLFSNKNYLKNRTALGRFGTIDELTSVVVFLSSDNASFFHGSIVQPDGGQSRQYMSFNYL